MAVESFVSKHLELLEIEKEAEIEENKCLRSCASLANLQRKGICLPKLRLGCCRTGLFGKYICTFEPYSIGKSFGSHNITTGDIIGMATAQNSSGRETIASGVVSHVTQTAISVSFDETFDFLGFENDVQYQMYKLANEVTYKRMKRALLYLKNKYHSSKLVNILFGETEPTEIPSVNTSYNIDELFLNTGLDNSQKEAVKFALSQQEVAIVHGPPGTGKTTTVVEIILQSVKQGLKILACAPSNIAVDNLVERLAPHKIRMVRLGHPARLLCNILQYSLDAVLAQSDEEKIVNDIRSEIDTITEKSRQCKNKWEREKFWKKSKSLYKELREREKIAVQRILKEADVILSTLVTSSDDGPLKHLPPDHFNLIVIDECSQAIEAACWIPLFLAPKCILAGDHHQLPPTIVSEKAANEGLAVSLMERLVQLHGDKITRMLFIQYRMHEDIMAWPSMQLYENKLVAHSSVSQHLLKDLSGVEFTEETSTPLLLIDTAGCQLLELDLEEEESKGNEGEADLVTVHIEKLVNSGIKPSDIAVITPYNLQVDLLKLRMSSKYPSLEIKSIDGFQGREKEAVVLSFVRSNDKGEVGFLAEDRRINVAITRARRHLAVICDSETVSHHEFLKSFIEYLTNQGDIQTAHQYETDLEKVDINRPEHLQFKKSQVTNTKPKCEKKKKVNNLEQKTNKNLCLKSESKQNSKDKTSTVYNKGSTLDQKLVEKQMKITIDNFLQDNKTTLEFPPSLSAYERRIVHELAENAGLIHESCGEGTERYIVITKKEEINNINCEQTSNDEHDQSHNKLKVLTDNNMATSIKTEKKCAICLKAIPENNFNLHTMHCKPAVKETNKKSKPQPKTNTVINSISEDENFDALLSAVTKSDCTCHFSKCKTNITTLGQMCQFCKYHFCFSHHMPEIHGCGDAVRMHARSQIRKEGKLYSGSGVPSKQPDPVKRAQLQRKLDRKLAEMSQQRKTKNK